jgi:hypothetical protein
MKRVWTLVAVFVVLAALIGGYFYLQSRPKPEQASKPSVDISKFDENKLVKVVITRRDGKLTLEKKDKGWTAVYPYPVVLSTSSLENLTSTLSSLSADSVIEEKPANLAQYGLAPPRATVDAYLLDGTVKTLYLGDKSPSGSSYYLQAKGDPRVFTVPAYVGNQFEYTLSDLREKSITPEIKAEEISYFRVRERGGTVIELLEKTAGEKTASQFGFGKFIMTRPYSYPVGTESEKTDAFIKGPTQIQISDFVDDNPKSLAPYGLDRPWGEVTVRDKANTLTLEFGADKGKDKTCFKISGSPAVYTVDKSYLSFMDTKPFNLVEPFVFIPNILDVDRIDIRTGSVSHVLAMARTEGKKTQEAGESKEESPTVYTADGKPVLESNFKKFYQILIGLLAAGDLEKKTSGAPELTVTYHLNKGETREVTVSFLPYDQDFDAVLLNGKQNFAMAKSQLQPVYSGLEKLLRGEKPAD